VVMLMRGIHEAGCSADPIRARHVVEVEGVGRVDDLVGKWVGKFRGPDGVESGSSACGC
jgi:hypothetical protein